MTMESNVPFQWEPDNESSNINSYKKISIIRYETQYPFNLNDFSQHFKSNILKLGRDFGCIDVKNNENSTHLLFAKMGDKRHSTPIFNSNTKEYMSRTSFKLKKIIVSTTHVDNFPGENKNLNLLLFNGGGIKNETLFAQYRPFLSNSQPKQLEFYEVELRKLCFGKFENYLSEITFNPVKEPGFGNTQHADYKSETKKLLDHSAEKIKELKENTNIRIIGFKSSIPSTHEDLSREYEIKFSINSNGKIELEFPKLFWKDLDSEEEIELKFYEFARKIYDEIVNPNLYRLPLKHPIANNQGSLSSFFGESDE